MSFPNTGITVFDGFAGLEDMREKFEIDLSCDHYRQLRSATTIIACYDCYAYDGHAFVLFQTSDGMLYEVNASHCSCYGLEGQWKPEVTTYEALIARNSLSPTLKSLIRALRDRELTRREFSH
jgi:hypothetical protein